MRKLNGMLRYSEGTALDGFSITGMAYSNRWNSTDQVPERAILSGQLERFGAEDPSDGGNTSRFSLSERLVRSDDAGSWKANAYVIQSTLDLFNNFTYFLNNPRLATNSTSTTTALSQGPMSRELSKVRSATSPPS